MKKFLSLLFLAGFVSLGLSAQGLEVGGELRSRTSFGWQSGDLHETRQSFSLNLDYWGQDAYFHVSPYATIDPRLVPTDGLVNAPDLGVREAYLDLYFSALDLRIGKQAVFWGQAEGAFITDLVSPQDLSSFILADFDEIRIGVPAVKASLYTGPLTWEVVWVQRFVPSVLPGAGSLWRTSTMPTLSSAVVPSASLENSEVFGRVSLFTSAITVDLMGGYAWDDLPTATGNPTSPTLSYHRSPMVGTVISSTLGPFVVRSEGAIIFDKHYSERVAGLPPSLVANTANSYQGLVGLDWSLGGFNLSTQYLFQYLTEPTHTATFRVNRTFLDDRLTTSVFTYLGFDPLDSLIRPEVKYSIEDGLEVAFGADIFVGEDDGRFGTYEDRSQGTVSLRWNF